jgi:hypothetical protein
MRVPFAGGVVCGDSVVSPQNNIRPFNPCKDQRPEHISNRSQLLVSHGHFPFSALEEFNLNLP